MSIASDEFISDLLYSPEYLPDVLNWYKKQPKEDGHISKASMETILKIISVPCWKKFRQAAESSCELTQDDFESGEFMLLIKTGITYLQSVRMLGKPGQAYNLNLTDEAKQIFSTFDVERFQREKLRNASIHYIATAAVNAYGIIEKKRFIDLFNHICMGEPADSIGAGEETFDPLMPDELESALAPYSEMRIGVIYVNGFLVNRILYNDDPEDIPRFLSNVSTDNYHQFDTERLLAYIDYEYYESTPQILSFLDEVEAQIPDLTEPDLYMIRLIFAPRYLIEWTQLIEDTLCPMLKSLSKVEQEKLAELFVEAIRSARSWRFRGFSENEIAPDGEGQEDEVREFMRVLEEC